MRLRVDKFGRMIIPKPMRRRMGIEPGGDVEVQEEGMALRVTAVQEEPAVIRKNGLLMCTAKPLVDLDDAIRQDREKRERHVWGGPEQ
ncbi:MAG: AbrB/MazE/SpoVT family DNA-binding domain-containing protein [Planctomycetota bacterium]|jgi:AbrB family looped-hinge helix DNA binding protein